MYLLAVTYDVEITTPKNDFDLAGMCFLITSNLYNVSVIQ